MQRILCLIAGLLAGYGAACQVVRIDQSFGLATTYANFSDARNFLKGNTTVHSDYRFRIKQYGIVYGPKVDVLATKDVSISLAMPVMLGLAITHRYRSYDMDGSKTDTIEGLRGSRVAFEIPVFAELNIGLRSAADERQRMFGLFAGAGYSYSFTQVKTTEGYIPFDRWEPVVRAGIRFGNKWENRYSLAFTLRRQWQNGSQPTYGLQLMKEL